MSFLAALFVAALQPAMVGPQIVTTPRAPRDCGQQVEGEDIVVCGQGDRENSPYRIPQQFRDLRSDDDAHASWDARWRDEEALGRYSDQTVGPFGYLQRGRQLYCEWLAERQTGQNRRPDCGRKPRPDDPSDWQRR